MHAHTPLSLASFPTTKDLGETFSCDPLMKSRTLSAVIRAQSAIGRTPEDLRSGREKRFCGSFCHLRSWCKLCPCGSQLWSGKSTVWYFSTPWSLPWITCEPGSVNLLQWAVCQDQDSSAFCGVGIKKLACFLQPFLSLAM